MQCANCGTQNRSGARFCKHCGAPLPAIPVVPAHSGAPDGVNLCANCGASLRPGARFCARCGQPVAGRPAPPASAARDLDARAVPLSDGTAWAPPPAGSGPPAYASPVYAGTSPPAQPVAAKRGARRWPWFVVGLGLVAVVAVLAVRVLLMLNPFKDSGGAEAPAALVTAISTEDMALAVSSNPVAVGEPLSVTVTFTNTQDVDVQNLHIYLEEAGQPALHPAGETTILVSDHVIAPSSGETWTFVLEAAAAGEGPVAASVSAERATDPPAPGLWRIGPLTVSVEAQP